MSAFTRAQIEEILRLIDANAITPVYLDTQKIDSAQIDTLSADKLTSGTISAQTIKLSGVSSVIQTDNFVAGSTGWQMKGDGSVEFGNAIVRGSYQSAASGQRIQVAPNLTLSDGSVGSGIYFQTGNASEGTPPQVWGAWKAADNSPTVALSSGDANGASDNTALLQMWGDNRGAATPKYGVISMSATRGVFIDTRNADAQDIAFNVDQRSGTRSIAFFQNSVNGKEVRFLSDGDITTTGDRMEVAAGGRFQFTGALEYLFHDNATAGSERIALIANNVYRISAYRTSRVDLTADDVRLMGSGSLTVTKSGSDHDIRTTTGAFNITSAGGATGVQVQLLDGVVHIRNKANSAWENILALSFDAQSDERLKHNVRPSDMQHLVAVASAPVKQWEDLDGKTHCGPSAQDLPELVLRPTTPTGQGEPDLMVSLGSMVGVLWGAVQELAARIGV